MNIENTWTVSGTLKPLKEGCVKEYKGNYQLSGWITQRDTARLSNGDAIGERYIVGMKINAKDPRVIKQILEIDQARQGSQSSQPVTLTGRITQWVSKSKVQGQPDQFVYDLEVFDVVTH